MTNNFRKGMSQTNEKELQESMDDHLKLNSYGRGPRLPTFSRPFQYEHRKSKTSNRYLRYQWKRITEAKKNRDIRKATLIWWHMLQTSRAYQLYLFNTAVRHWYWALNKDEVIELLNKLRTKCRSAKLTLTMTRFYIPKKSGKLRTIRSTLLDRQSILSGFSKYPDVVVRGKQEGMTTRI